MGLIDIYELEDGQVKIYYDYISKSELLVKEVVINTHPQLSLDDIIRLSEKGEDLKLSDFEKYPILLMVVVCIFVDIYDLFDFAIGSAGIDDDSHIYYMNLYTNTENPHFIDIRTENVIDFIDKYNVSSDDIQFLKQSFHFLKMNLKTLIIYK